MFSRLTTRGLLALTLAAGLAAAHAQEAPVASGAGRPTPGRLDLTLHFARPAWPATPSAVAALDDPADLHGSTIPLAHDDGEHRLAPKVELLTGYEPYTVFDALDFKPRVGDYAVGIKLDF